MGKFNGNVSGSAVEESMDKPQKTAQKKNDFDT